MPACLFLNSSCRWFYKYIWQQLELWAHLFHPRWKQWNSVLLNTDPRLHIFTSRSSALPHNVESKNTSGGLLSSLKTAYPIHPWGTTVCPNLSAFLSIWLFSAFSCSRIWLLNWLAWLKKSAAVCGRQTSSHSFMPFYRRGHFIKHLDDSTPSELASV